jgi:hypothetical protein
MIFVKHFKMRFFAIAQNDIAVSFFVILRPKAEGSHVLMFFKNKNEILRFAQNDIIILFHVILKALFLTYSIFNFIIHNFHANFLVLCFPVIYLSFINIPNFSFLHFGKLQKKSERMRK